MTATDARAKSPSDVSNHPRACPQTARTAEFAAQCLPYQNALFAAAMRMTRQPDDAHDLVQETFMRALAAWPHLRHRANVKAWLFRILSNTFINNYRRRQRHGRLTRERPGETVSALYGDIHAHASTPEEMLLERALGDEVEAALADLEPGYRAILEMADLQDLRYRDIARKLRVPMGTVMSRLFRARRKLEKALASFAATDYGIRRVA